MQTLGLRLQGMSHVSADARYAVDMTDVLNLDGEVAAHHPALPSLPGIPDLQGNVLHYQPEHVEYLIGSVRNLIGIEQKRYTQIRNRRTQYASADGVLDHAVTLKATAKQHAICQQHAAVLCSLQDFLAQLAPESCLPQ